jgi:hypothetical protein
MEPNHCKVDNAIIKYDIGSQSTEFESINEELLAMWTGETQRKPLGYRSLAEYFNKQLLRNVYNQNGRLILGAQLEDELEILTGDDEIAQGELFDELKQDGIDDEEICSDLVSFSTIRRHLTGCLDGEKERQQAQTEWEQNSIEIALNTLDEKVAKSLSSYETKGEILSATDAEVSINIHLSCPECPTRRTLSDALQLGYVCEDHSK